MTKPETLYLVLLKQTQKVLNLVIPSLEMGYTSKPFGMIKRSVVHLLCCPLDTNTIFPDH